MKDILKRAVKIATDSGAKYADARLHTGEGERIVISRGRRSLSFPTAKGVGIRILFKNGWGLSSTTDLSKKSISGCVKRAIKLAKAYPRRKKVALADVKTIKAKVKTTGKINPKNMSTEEKLKLTEEQYKFCKSQRYIRTAITAMVSGLSKRIFVNSEGTEIEKEIQRMILQSAVVSGDGEKQREYYWTEGGIYGLELLKRYDWNEESKRVCNRARELLKSVPVPVGKMPVIFTGKGGGTGMLAHESVGHAVEGDYARMDRSFFNGKLSKRVAVEGFNLVDDGTKGSGNGAILYDDEGVKAQKTYVIKDGIFKTFLLDRESASYFNLKPTGNARAQDYSRRVYVRMRNTYIEPGDWKLDEMIKNMKQGILCDQVSAGMEDPSGGSFQIFFTDGYIVKKGETVASIYNPTISRSHVINALEKIDAIGKDFYMDSGRCGKGHEDFVYVGTGGPSIRISEVVVGGK